MRRLRLGDSEVEDTAGDIAVRLADAFARREHPLCLCQPEGVPMYVARAGGRHVLKRMPGSGPRHDPDCDSYEPPHALSGLGAVDGGAIVENAEDGVTLLKLDFSLSKQAGRTAPTPREAIDAGAVKTDGSRLSLRALLHYLWEQAEFNRWRPAMTGRRNWAVLRKFLLEAAEGKTAKGKTLPDVLFIPEMFDADRDAAIAQRRETFLSRAMKAEGNRRSLAMLIGEVKEIAPARFGHRVVIKHLPRFPFMLNEDAHRRINAVFASELALWNATADSHLIAIATFGIDAAGIASIESIALMVVTDRWLPFENRYEAALIDALAKRGASFVKSLRYNLPAAHPMACVVLRQDGAAPLGMYIVPDGAGTDYREKLDELIAESGIASWTWNIGDGAMPELPA
ncbi:DUF1173 domain-containing protein [Ancylobacter polymorphus]|uniref:DUF1173 domain-containing protein n=1 Tax=Ancylobacter polymorphus TaxID=223390 RepID=A0A9E7CYD1_9HYPH|nr:DUF1173 domain-containing protein [Ancylobacter polymorphus]UOK73389.1 DUF1173 domain-containing protein [Ancylobacter polymorphus]